MPRLILSIILILVYYPGFSQWSIKTISDEMITNSSTVIRRYATDIKVVDENKILIAENIVVTFLDNTALEEFIWLNVVTNNVANSLEFRMFDLNGKRLKQLKAKAIMVNSGFKIDLENQETLNLPLTVETEYKLVVSSTNLLKAWNPTMNHTASVENASLRVSVSDSSMVNPKYYKISPPIMSVDEDGLYVFLWELNMFHKIKTGNSIELPANELPLVEFFNN